MPLPLSLSTNITANYSVDYLTDCNEYLKEMSEFALKDTGDLSYKTNVYAKMSGYDIHKTTGLFNDIAYRLGDIIKELAWVDKSYDIFLKNLWTAVYREGDYTIPHTHSNSTLSFVLCLEDSGISHPLVFTDSGLEIEMHRGKLVIFPGFIKHHVPLYRYKEPRIMLAGNFRDLVELPGGNSESKEKNTYE